jgi:hypothetical protein
MKPQTYQTKVNLPGLDVELRFDSQQLALWASSQTYDFIIFLINFLVVSAGNVYQLGYNTKCWVRLQTQEELELFLILVKVQATKFYKIIWLNPWQEFTDSIVSYYERLALWLLKAVGQELAEPPRAPLAFQQAPRPNT